MAGHRNNKSPDAELRRRAEEQLGKHPTGTGSPLAGADQLHLLHELQVYQIELELQNAELRQSRNAAEAAYHKYSTLYDFAPIGYFTLDRRGTIKAVNLAGAALLGVERAKLVGRHLGLFVPTARRGHFQEFISMVFESGGKESCEVDFTTELNIPLVLHVEAVALGGKEECSIAVIDVTERSRAAMLLSQHQKELEELNRHLEARIGQAVAELRKKDKMLIIQERLAIMGEMVNNIAHQWRQPLNTLGLLVQQLPLYYGSKEFTKEMLEENSSKSMQLIRHMSQTIDDFRNFFRSDKEAVTFSLDKVIGTTLSLVRDSFKNLQISLVLQSEGAPAAFGFPNEYAQVLLNILMNARDALVERSITAPRITIHAYANGGTSIVTITDNAGGIDEKIIDRLFDPYFTTKDQDKGTGIGLFMAKTIIETNMAGKLTVRNTGTGAEFRIEV
jgi:PAS domain S-box-containing protein